jgi:hypothetical protein
LFDGDTRRRSEQSDDAILYADESRVQSKSAQSSGDVTGYQRKGDMPNAIAEMEKAVAIDPALQPQLNNLKKPAAGTRRRGAGGARVRTGPRRGNAFRLRTSRLQASGFGLQALGFARSRSPEPEADSPGRHCATMAVQLSRLP